MSRLLGEDEIEMVRRLSGLTSTDDIGDDDILLLFNDADDIIKEETGYEFESTEITEKYDGDDTVGLQLNHRPAIEIKSLVIGTTIITNYILYESQGRIEIKENDINGNLFVFTKGQQNVVVNYTYGISSERLIGIAKSLAKDLTIRDMFKFVGAKKSKGIQSEKYIDYALTYKGMPYGESVAKLKEDIERKFALLGKERGEAIF